jgi:hypothetical protein
VRPARTSSTDVLEHRTRHWSDVHHRLDTLDQTERIEKEEQMNKKAAVAVAGGLTGALASGLAGYSVRVAHQSSASAQPATKPIVKTQVRTITIHKKPKIHHAATAPLQTVVVHRPPTIVPLARAPASAPISHTSASHAAGGESEGGDGGDGGGD